MQSEGKNIGNTNYTLQTNLSYSNVAGHEKIKNLLKEYILLPLLFPDLFKGCRRPSKAVLLFGAPGVGKTFLAQATAGELLNSSYGSKHSQKVFYISCCDLISRYRFEG